METHIEVPVKELITFQSPQVSSGPSSSIVPKRLEDTYNQNKYKESMDFKLKHNTLKQKVLSILKSDKQARHDYFWLCLLVWIKQDAIKFIIPLEDYSKMYKPESISRIARELFEEARNGEVELQFLLKDTKTLDKRDNLRGLNYDYFQDKNNSELASFIK